MLTGNKDTDFIILNKLKDYELTQVCQANKYVNSLCNDDLFWMNRVLDRFGKYLGSSKNIRENYLNGRTWKEYYMYMRDSLKEFSMHSVRSFNNEFQRRIVKNGEFIEWAVIKEEDLIKLLEVKQQNNNEINNFAKKGDINGVKKLLNLEDYFVNKENAYYTNNPDIMKYLIENKIPFWNWILTNLVSMEYYEGIREFLKDPRVNFNEIMNHVSTKPEMRKIAVESGKLNAGQLKGIVLEAMTDNNQLNYNDLLKIYNIIE